MLERIAISPAGREDAGVGHFLYWGSCCLLVYHLICVTRGGQGAVHRSLLASSSRLENRSAFQFIDFVMFRLHKQFQNFRYGLESPRACVYLGWLRFALKSNQGHVSGLPALGVESSTHRAQFGVLFVPYPFP